MLMLCNEKTKINVLIININSSNMFSFQLLDQALNLDITSFCVCDEYNEHLAKKVLHEGAYLYLEKPFDGNILKYIWQFVLTEKRQREKARKESERNGDKTNIGDFDNNDIINNVVKRKGCTEWTANLHAKFLNAVQQLGDGRCYPREILELMNVPGLTRMQVASHLQKYRLKNGRASGELKPLSQSSYPRSSRDSQQRGDLRKYGVMPRLQKNISIGKYNSDQTQRGQQFSFSPINTNNISSRGGSSIRQQLNLSQQLNLPQHQYNAADGLQQHEPLFEFHGSQGLQVPVIGNTNYMPNLASNSVNASNMATHPGNAMVFDTYVENGTINELGAADENLCIGEQNMFDPRNIIVTSHENDIEGRDPNEKENCDEYFNINDMDYLFQNLGPPNASLPNEQGTDELDEVTTTSSVQFFGVANHSDKSSI